MSDVFRYELYKDDCLNILKTLLDNSLDSIVTDPPYGINFMNSRWDYNIPSIEIWKECYRVIKPGGHLISFGGTRTYHRLVVSIEDAGFDIRDQVQWIYGSGFPKNLDVGKSIEKSFEGDNSSESQKWSGWGTALKPAHEPICLTRKRLDGTVANNVVKWGTGSINIDACRVDGTKEGRWPANIIHDSSEEVVSCFPITNIRPGSPTRNNKAGPYSSERTWSTSKTPGQQGRGYTDTGSAARFFYSAKAGKSERDAGLNGFPSLIRNDGRNQDLFTGNNPYNRGNNPKVNHHPTVKPIDLMRYLCRLVTPVGGTLLDPFMGSGSTGIGALLEGFNFVGIENNEEYFEIAKSRIEYFVNNGVK